MTDAGLKELATLTGGGGGKKKKKGGGGAGGGGGGGPPPKNLNTLDLSDTKVTDAGVKELAPHKNLTTLDHERREGDGCGSEGTSDGIAWVQDHQVTHRVLICRFGHPARVLIAKATLEIVGVADVIRP